MTQFHCSHCLRIFDDESTLHAGHRFHIRVRRESLIKDEASSWLLLVTSSGDVSKRLLIDFLVALEDSLEKGFVMFDLPIVIEKGRVSISKLCIGVARIPKEVVVVAAALLQQPDLIVSIHVPVLDEILADKDFELGITRGS